MPTLTADVSDFCDNFIVQYIYCNICMYFQNCNDVNLIKLNTTVP